MRLSGLPIAQVRYFETIGSTNDEALNWVSGGAADGSLVIADRQTSGRGRLGRRWVTRPGSALAFSLILLPTQEEMASGSLFSALGALGICQALEQEPGLSPQIKWPNDILLNRKKAAGILVETSWLGSQVQGIVIGIGINIAREAVPPASELLFPATCVEEAAGKKVDRLDLLRACLKGIYDWRARLRESAFRAAWQERLAFKGEMVSIQEAANPASAPLNGEVFGLDETGNLLLRDASGELHRVNAGDVHLRPANG